MTEGESTPADETGSDPSDGEESGGPTWEKRILGSPRHPALWERVAAIVVLVLMALSMAYLLWIVVRYWGDIQV